MNSQELEFAISQYMDGVLPIEQVAVLEDRLRTDPAARAILDDLKKLDQLVRASAPTLPQMHWDRLALQLSQTIADHTAAPVYRISFYRAAAGLALAASLLLAVGIFWPRPSATKVSSPSELIVLGPQAEPAAGPMELDVSVGQPPAPDIASAYTLDGVVVQRSMVALDGFTGPGNGDFH